MIVEAGDAPPTAPDGYVVRRFRLRGWWVPDYSDVGFGDLVTWFFTRETWNPTGSYDQYLIIREVALT